MSAGAARGGARRPRQTHPPPYRRKPARQVNYLGSIWTGSVKAGRSMRNGLSLCRTRLEDQLRRLDRRGKTVLLFALEFRRFPVLRLRFLIARMAWQG